MSQIEQKNEIKINNHRNGIVHFVLLNSYLVFLFAVVLGVFLDSFIKNKLYFNNTYQSIGFLMLIIGSVIIYWAQKTSSNSKKRINENSSKPYLYFEFGPYRYLRSPTYFGLFIMTLGFSLIINSLFGVVLNIVAYIIIRLFFLKEEERLLEIKYGQAYSDYRKRVKNWI